MLKITASQADGIPVNLRDTLTGLDDHNVQLLITVILSFRVNRGCDLHHRIADTVVDEMSTAR
jgi:hypothetical protein